MAHHNLDSLDKKILKLIAEDARIPFLEVARSCIVSGHPSAHTEAQQHGCVERLEVYHRPGENRL